MVPYLADKRILITGAANPLGLAITSHALDAGAQVVAIAADAGGIGPRDRLSIVQSCLANVGSIAALAEIGPIDAAIVMIDSPVFVPCTLSLTRVLDTLAEQQTVQVNALAGLPSAIAAAGGGLLLLVESIAPDPLPEPWKTICRSWNLSSKLSSDGWSVYLAPLGVEVVSIPMPSVSHRLVEVTAQRQQFTQEVVDRLSEKLLASLLASFRPAAAVVWLAENSNEVSTQT